MALFEKRLEIPAFSPKGVKERQPFARYTPGAFAGRVSKRFGARSAFAPVNERPCAARETHRQSNSIRANKLSQGPSGTLERRATFEYSSVRVRSIANGYEFGKRARRMERRTECIDYQHGGWAEIQYVGDRKDGLWSVYRKDGSKHWEREYTAGKQNGYERIWDEAGWLIDEKWFYDGKLHGVWRIWDSNGVLRQLSTFDCGNQEGLQSWWDESGGVVAQGTVTAGVREGTFVAAVCNAAETATKRMVLEYRHGQLLTDLHWG